VFLGAHATVWAGLRGARGEAQIPWPAGLETVAGAEISVADGIAGITRYIDPLEVGLEAQAAIVGFNFGIQIMGIVDLATGLILIDLQDDDF